MPPTRSTRSRPGRNATKRTIMGILEDSDANAVAEPPSDTKGNTSEFSTQVDELDRTNLEQICLLIGDIETRLEEKKMLITAERDTGKNEMKQEYDIGMSKITPKIKKMTIKEFNETYKCNLFDMMRDVSKLSGNKRDHEIMETPANPKVKCSRVPGTVSRTIRRGEQVFSKNGSPVDQVDEGALVATVTKKRRGNRRSSAALDLKINVGEGRYIDLGDPGTMQHMDQKMKNSAFSQMKALQDQLGVMLSQFAEEEKE